MKNEFCGISVANDTNRCEDKHMNKLDNGRFSYRNTYTTACHTAPHIKIMTLFMVLICIRHNRNNNEMKKQSHINAIDLNGESLRPYFIEKSVVFFCMFRLIPINLLVYLPPSLSHFLFCYHRMCDAKCQSHIN